MLRQSPEPSTVISAHFPILLVVVPIEVAMRVSLPLIQTSKSMSRQAENDHLDVDTYRY